MVAPFVTAATQFLSGMAYDVTGRCLPPHVEQGTPEGSDSGSTTDPGTVVAAVVVPVVVVLLLALLAALLYVRRARRKVLQKRVATTAPGPGWVVLCVTDIENSTTLVSCATSTAS